MWKGRFSVGFWKQAHRRFQTGRVVGFWRSSIFYTRNCMKSARFSRICLYCSQFWDLGDTLLHDGVAGFRVEIWIVGYRSDFSFGCSTVVVRSVWALQDISEVILRPNIDQECLMYLEIHPTDQILLSAEHAILFFLYLSRLQPVFRETCTREISSRRWYIRYRSWKSAHAKRKSGRLRASRDIR